MPVLVFWNSAKYTLEDAVVEGKIIEMANSIHGSSSTYTLDCIDAAESASKVFGGVMGTALKNGDEYLDLSEEEVSSLVFENSYDCCSTLFDEKHSELIKVYKRE